MNVGDTAPDFALPDQCGNEVRLSRARGPAGTVVFFYPRDNTPLCTREACAFRDAHAEFTRLGFTVLGISSDAPESHARFARNHNLPFPLLWDKDGGVRRLWGVPSVLGLLPGRVTYVLDGSNRVLAVLSSQFEPGRHAEFALEAAGRPAAPA